MCEQTDGHRFILKKGPVSHLFRDWQGASSETINRANYNELTNTTNATQIIELLHGSFWQGTKFVGRNCLPRPILYMLGVTSKGNS